MSTVLGHDPNLHFRVLSEEIKGKWKGGRVDAQTRTAVISCPRCGALISLTQHIIADNGTVTPSLVCPYDGCEFHDNIVLEDWTP